MAAERRGRLRRLATVRVRTTLLATLVVGAALAVGALALVALLHRALIANLDRNAELRARDIAAQTQQGDLPVTPSVVGEEQSLVQVLRGDRVVAASRNLQGEPPVLSPRPAGAHRVAVTLRQLPIGDGQPYRAVAISSDGRAGRYTVVVAVLLEQVNEGVATVEQILLVGTPALIALMALTTWLMVGRALRPVELMRRRMETISSAAGGQRIPEPGTHDEIGRLADTMNGMLGRLERSADRQRRFAGDASHELQSPLAAIRTELEVSTAHPADTDWLQTAGTVLDETGRMERLVRNLLFLARRDETRPVERGGIVDLDDIVLREAKRIRPSSPVPVHTGSVQAASVAGPSDDLARLVRNLLENASLHATSWVEVGLRSDDGCISLRVEDDGPGIPVDARERIFERFARLDPARGRGGTGLGLAIVKDIVEAHRGTVRVTQEHHGACFLVTLPWSG